MDSCCRFYEIFHGILSEFLTKFQLHIFDTDTLADHICESCVASK